MAASTRSPPEKQPERQYLDIRAVPRGTERRSRAAREAARATPQLAAAPVPPVAGEQRPQAATCKAALSPKRVGLIFRDVSACITRQPALQNLQLEGCTRGAGARRHCGPPGLKNGAWE